MIRILNHTIIVVAHGRAQDLSLTLQMGGDGVVSGKNSAKKLILHYFSENTGISVLTACPHLRFNQFNNE